MSWPTGCDPFWSELNAGCSDEFGNYKQPAGGSTANVLVIGATNPVLPNIVTRSAAPVVRTGSAPTMQQWVAGVPNTALFVGVVGALAALIFLKR